MSKVILSTLCAALVCVVVTSAKAAEGISAGAMSDMGLSALTVMSDSDGLAVRGKGFQGCRSCGPRGKMAPSSKAFGNSFATIQTAECENCAPSGGSHSENGYLAEGPYAASGENYSEAGATVIKIESVDIDGVVKSVTTTASTMVWAGGNSSAMSF
jgi:hypothetical protein